MKKLVLGLFSIGLGLLPQSNFSQSFDCDLIVPPFEVNGVEVDHLLTENLGYSLVGPTVNICLNENYPAPRPTVWLGVPLDGFGWYPFVYKIIFSRPVNFLSFTLLVGAHGFMDIDYGAENFVFTTPNCGLTLSDIYSCYTLIEGDTIYLGVGNTGTGWFSVTFDEPVLEFTISGKGGGNGSGFQICSNSIQVAPLWASIQAPEAICVQDSVLFTAYEGVAATHPPPYTFSYTLNGVAQTATTTSTSDSVWVLTPTTPGTYTYELLSVTDANGNSVNISCNNTRVVEVQAAPIAQFTASPSSGMAPLEVTTQNQSSNATQYEWTIGGFGSAQPPAVEPPTSADEAPVFTFQDTGVYEITLIASNALGCTDTAKQTIHVLEELQVVIPNVFTPNNDGINDWFGITANVSVPASIVILNRWGNVVFEKEFVTTAGDFVELWDGTSTSSVTTPSSVVVTDGVYFYRIALEGEGWS